MFMAKNNKMTIEVKGVKGDGVMCRELMKEIVRRNCKVDPRIVDSMVDRVGISGEIGYETYDYQIELENYDIVGITKDFELLKKADVIKQVIKTTCYIVY